MTNDKSVSRPWMFALLAILALPCVVRAASFETPASLPRAEQILSKYQSFLGGATQAAKITTRTVITRRFETGAHASDEKLVRYSKTPMLSIMHHETLDGGFVGYTNGCDAAGGWVGYGKLDATGAPNPGKASTDGVCEQEQYYYGYLPLNLTRLMKNVGGFEVTGLVSVTPAEPGPSGQLAGGHGNELIAPGPRQAYLLLAKPVRATDPFVWLYFDAKTGALLRRMDAGPGPTPVPPSDNARTTDFIQYRNVGDGTRAPFQFVTTAPNSQVRGVTLSIVDNTPVANSVFIRPKNVHRQDKGL